MRNLNDPRHIARILSVMDLYEHFFGQQFEGLTTLGSEELDIGNYSKKMRESIVSGVKEKFHDIDKIIDAFSEPMKTADLDLLILQIIRISLWEGFVSKSVPPKVAVDEAIELARDFGLDLEAKKVGGILGKVFDNLVKKEPVVKE